LFSADSVRTDSSQAYKTLKGRTVYGGGGVVPDVFVPTDTAEGSAYLTELFFSGLLNQFSFDVADRDRDKLRSKYKSSTEFAERYTVSESLLEELKRLAVAQGIDVRADDAQRSKEQIAIRLKAGIARNVWGDDGYYRILLEKDAAYREAKKAFEAPLP
jgi:carboxyl-terminal processing protease